MKIWSPLLATLLLLYSVNTQEVTIEAIEDDTDFDISADFDTEPCNGFPEYLNLPINQAFYLGTRLEGQKNVIQLLEDGLRYLDIQLCTNEKNESVVCKSNATFDTVLHDTFLFARENPEQFFVVNLDTTDLKQAEKAMDKVCKVHSELTAGTDEYVEFKCPFIYKHEKGPWPSIGELVNYNPEMAQWEGDGELVGVRTKMLFTTNSNDPEYTPSFFTPSFSREVAQNGLKQELKKDCRVPAGGIKVNAINENYTPAEIEDLLLDRSGCNLNDSPLNTFISILSINNYKDHVEYFSELKGRMMQFNYARWNGQYELVKPSMIEKSKIQRDEL